jgi:ABC-type transport system substrate-binding protein
MIARSRASLFMCALPSFIVKFTRKKKPLRDHTADVRLLQKLRGRSIPTWSQIRHVGRLLSATERRVFRGAFALLIVGLLWSGGVLTSQYRDQVPAVGGSYLEAVVGTPKNINPLFAAVNDVDLDLTRLIYAGLMRYDEHQSLQPDLAESFELSEDKKTYTFTLRPGVTWHDGEPLTADDIAFTFELIQDPLVGSPLFVSFNGVLVQVVDDRTVSFVLNEPFQPFLGSLTVGILPAHIWADVPIEQLVLAKPNLQPIGAGPYQFSKLAKDDTGFVLRYELKRNENYHLQPPYIEEFVFKFFGDYETDLGAIHALRQQKVDGLHFVPANLKERVARKHINIHTLQLPQYTALFYNQKRKSALEEADLRTALAYAIDKDRILRESLGGDGQVIYSPILPGFPAYNEQIEKTPYSIEQANELLDETYERLAAEAYRQERFDELFDVLKQEFLVSESVTSTEDVEEIEISSSTHNLLTESVNLQLDQQISDAQLFYRKDGDDDVLSLSLVTADTAEYRQAAKLIAGFWQDIGVQTQIVFVSPKDMTREVLRERKYDVLLYGIIVGSDPDQFPFWHSSQTQYPGLNLSQYVNRSVDTILEEARELDSEEELAKKYQEFEEKILSDRPAVFLHTPIYRYATTDRVQGIDVGRIFHPSDRFAGVTSWFVKTKGKWRF